MYAYNALYLISNFRDTMNTVPTERKTKVSDVLRIDDGDSLEGRKHSKLSVEEMKRAALKNGRPPPILIHKGYEYHPALSTFRLLYGLPAQLPPARTRSVGTRPKKNDLDNAQIPTNPEEEEAHDANFVMSRCEALIAAEPHLAVAPRKGVKKRPKWGRPAGGRQYHAGSGSSDDGVSDDDDDGLQDDDNDEQEEEEDDDYRANFYPRKKAGVDVTKRKKLSRGAASATASAAVTPVKATPVSPISHGDDGAATPTDPSAKRPRGRPPKSKAAPGVPPQPGVKRKREEEPVPEPYRGKRRGRPPNSASKKPSASSARSGPPPPLEEVLKCEDTCTSLGLMEDLVGGWEIGEEGRREGVWVEVSSPRAETPPSPAEVVRKDLRVRKAPKGRTAKPAAVGTGKKRGRKSKEELSRIAAEAAAALAATAEAAVAGDAGEPAFAGGAVEAQEPSDDDGGDVYLDGENMKDPDHLKDADGEVDEENEHEIGAPPSLTPPPSSSPPIDGDMQIAHEAPGVMC
ncbi:hypothetical protein HK101_010587 [Irineochytrium annulatum]|nr:hypothetical protein HK101_010587 [Irineochytrium annulatum]